jgi:iron complex outermembrane receptor protein
MARNCWLSGEVVKFSASIAIKELSLLLTIALQSPARVAAQSGPESYEPIPQIIVTARRRNEDAQDVPIPISALTGASLEASGRFRIEDLNQVLPSTNIQYNGPRQTSFALRGLGNSPANDALESSVAVYIDDVYLGRASMANFDLIDLDQVTLLRGSQGALFGKNTTAGVLSIASQAPSFTPGGSAEASYGDYEYNQVRGVWSQPLKDDELAARISLVRTSREGFVLDTTTGRKLDGVERVGGRGQLLWKSGEVFTLRLIGDYAEEHSEAGAFVLYSAGPNGGAKYYQAVAAAGATVVYSPDYDLVTIDGRQHFDVRQGGGSAKADWQLGDYKLTSITAYRSWWFSPYSDADYTNRDAISAAGQRVNDNQWTQELRLASPSGRALDYVIGLFYFDQHQANGLYTQYGTDSLAITALKLGTASYADGYVQTAQYLNTHSASAFGHVTWRASDAWEFAAGLRDTSEQKDVSLVRTSSGLPGFVANPNFDSYVSGDLTRRDNTLSASLSASRRFSPDILAYASIARGAKSGGINPAAPAPGLTVNSLYFEPEFSNDAELGVKSILWSSNLLLNINLFWMQIQDYQATLLLLPTATSALTQIISNVGNVRTRGVEADLTSSIGALTFNLAASLNDVIYLSYHDAPCSAEELAPLLAPGQKVCDLTGRPLLGAPRWIINPGMTYAHPGFGDSRWTAQLNFAWRSSFFGSADDSQYAQVPSYGLLNLRWSIQPNPAKPWTISLWSNNICDKRYVLGGLSVSGPLYYYVATPGLPRTVGATLHIDF